MYRAPSFAGNLAKLVVQQVYCLGVAIANAWLHLLAVGLNLN